MAGAFGALSAVSDWYDPETGETRDGAERVGHGLLQTLYFPVYHALGVASARMLGAVQDKGALTKAGVLALGSMMENAGFTIVDAQLREPLFDAIQEAAEGDTEAMQREAEKFVQGTLSFMALHAGSVANIPRMQRGSSRFGAGSQPGGGQRQPGGGGAAQREFDFPDTPGHRRSGWNSQETAWAHDPRNRSYAQRTEPGVLMDLMDGRMRLQDVGVEVDKSGIRAHNGKLIVHVDGKLFATDLLEPGQWSEYHDTEVRLTPPAPPNQQRIAATVGQELAQLQLPDELRPLAAKTVELLATVNRQVDEPVEDALRVVEDGTLFEALRRNPAEALLGWARI